MPHYITQLDDQDPAADRYAIYSTVVDNLITHEMTAEQMLKCLQEDDRYETWLMNKEDRHAYFVREYGADTADDIGAQSPDEYEYWHELGFAYVKLSDAYYVLPRSYWRD
jgi:hypothetical protein